MIRVVVVDDDEGIREMLRMRLSLDFVVLGVAANGEQGVALVSKLRPDVVIMDFDMPVMNGVDATRQIRQIEAEVRIVSFTSSSLRAPQAMREAGAEAAFGKHDVESLVQYLLQTG